MNMLIKQIMDGDIENCYEALKNDKLLQATDECLYTRLSELPGDIQFELESIVSKYMARVTRIAYLQGIVDFTKLFVTLKEEPDAILKKYVDV